MDYIVVFDVIPDESNRIEKIALVAEDISTIEKVSESYSLDKGSYVVLKRGGLFQVNHSFADAVKIWRGN